MTDDTALLTRLAAAAGPGGLLVDPADMAPYLADERQRLMGAALAIARPASTEAVSALVTIAAAEGLPIVPRGGGTGLVGGSVASGLNRALVLSLDRMNRIRDLNPLDGTMVAEAGVILADARAAADAVGLALPLSYGSEGTARIGGALSANSGGVLTIRHGNARARALGLEVVLADGRVWNGLRRLRKDNMGYDLKHLFIGAEGTLGIITAAVLQLSSKPASIETVLVALPSVEAALLLLRRLRSASGDGVEAFELMPRMGVEWAVRHIERVREPNLAPAPWYALVELAAGRDTGLRTLLEDSLTEALEAGEIAGAAFADSSAGRERLWQIREGLVEAQKFEGGSIKHDVAVPVSLIPQLIEQVNAAAHAWMPGVRPLPFGHVGDGNIHFNFSQPEGMDPAAFLARWEEANRIVHDIVTRLGGTISAEHGIGRFKPAELARLRGGVELELMRRVKDALDPDGVMNPGVIFG